MALVDDFTFGTTRRNIRKVNLSSSFLAPKTSFFLFAKMDVAGEWWKADTEVIINQAMQSGGAPNISDAYTMNGLPGPLYNCSSKGIPINGFHFFIVCVEDEDSRAKINW